MGAIDAGQMISRIEALLAQKLAIRDVPLETGLRRAGRRLPRRMRAEGRVLVQAARLAGHPKLSRRIDQTRTLRAYERLSRHLTAIDPRDMRRGRILGVLGGLAFNLLLLGAALLALALWRGWV